MSKMKKHPVVMFVLVLACATSLLVAASLSDNDGRADSASNEHASAHATTLP